MAARYVLLRIDDPDQADDFLSDVLTHPHMPVITPGNRAVHFEVVDGIDPADGSRSAEELVRRVRETHDAAIGRTVAPVADLFCDHGDEPDGDEHRANCLGDGHAAARLARHEARWDLQGVSGWGQ